MTIKRQLHTIYLKHDSDFKTLSKKALAQVILKIVHIVKVGATLRQIKAELQEIVAGSISQNHIIDALKTLQKEKKVNAQRDRYYIHEAHKNKLDDALKETERLHSFILEKYFSKVETEKEIVLSWFQDTTIKFLEKFSFEWFRTASHKVKFNSTHIENLHEVIDDTFRTAQVIEIDKAWLKAQYIKFIDSEEAPESLLLWYYGISMFSSRLISAKNKADEYSVDTFRNSKLILDTNVLMILDLEAHDLHKSLESLERVLAELNIQLVYFAITRDEYLRAITHRKEEIINVFENYDQEILEASDCPFINTALKRKCQTGEDVKVMFEQLIDVPEVFHESIKIQRYENAEVLERIEYGQQDEKLKETINSIYLKRAKRNKRENPLSHDAALIEGASYIRKTDKCWILTNDSVLKIYGIEHCLRDEHEIAIGLDVLLGMLAVNDEANGLDASNFAPLFKNVIKLSLMPESDAFQVEDLAFILEANLKINELDNEKVLEIAREVKRMRIGGEPEEEISLYLRRALEKDKIAHTKDLKESVQREQLSNLQKEKVEQQRDAFIEEHKFRRRNELRDKYDRQLLTNRILMLILPTAIAFIVYLTVKVLLLNESLIYQFLGGAALEVIFGLLPLIPVHGRIVRRYSEYVGGIDRIIDEEVKQIRDRANR